MDMFYTPPERIHGSTLSIDGDEHRHLMRVMRKRVGDHIFVTDGDDTMHEAEIVRIDRTRTECDILRSVLRHNEPTTEITLAVSLLRNPARLEFVVEKATELGIRSFVPMLCERSVGHQGRLDRLEKIAIAAMKQSQRCYRPRIFPVTSFETLVPNAENYTLRLIPHEKIEQSQFVGSVLQHHEDRRSIIIVIGPEGGFTDGELELASSCSFIPISLGPRRLRAETAALSAVTWAVGGT